MIVVKVGGSLYDHPRLGPGLRAWIEQFGDEELLFVPGGGSITEQVRRYDALHGLGAEQAHWLALYSLWMTAGLLRALLPGSELSCSGPPWNPPGVRHHILDSHFFCVGRDDVPHSWAVTSDSIAARAAVVAKASRLILLKSLDIPAGTPWPTAAANGWVDAYFPTAVAGAAFPVEVVNFRRWMDERAAV